MDWNDRKHFESTTPATMSATIARTEIPIVSASAAKRGDDQPGYLIQLVFRVGLSEYALIRDGVEQDTFDEDQADRALAAFLTS